ncbi:MAG: small multi-drug export protein [Thermoanaerobacteraceae bacterium]|nr:small multi-drug export protein [Thermoanaerobacteraceae bacterium]
MTEWLIESVRGIPVTWQVFFLSMLPVTELRAAVPIGLAQGLAPLPALLFGVLGNLVPVVLLLTLLEPVSRWLSRFRLFKIVLDSIFQRTRAKSDKVEKYGAVGLLLFVGIPAPGTGVWTGSLLAFLLGIPFWRALWPICAGTFLAGILVTLVSLGIIELVVSGFGVLLLVLLVVFVFFMYWLRQGA